MTKYSEYDNVDLILLEAGSKEYIPELAWEICKRAGLLSEWEAADGENFESVLERAFEILKEEEGIYGNC